MWWVAPRVRPVAETPAAGESEAQLAVYHARIRAWLAPRDGSRGLRPSKVCCHQIATDQLAHLAEQERALTTGHRGEVPRRRQRRWPA